jgi:hypothetical protein
MRNEIYIEFKKLQYLLYSLQKDSTYISGPFGNTSTNLIYCM